jgi:hypothetical protein
VCHIPAKGTPSALSQKLAPSSGLAKFPSDRDGAFPSKLLSSSMADRLCKETLKQPRWFCARQERTRCPDLLQARLVQDWPEHCQWPFLPVWLSWKWAHEQPLPDPGLLQWAPMDRDISLWPTRLSPKVTRAEDLDAPPVPSRCDSQPHLPAPPGICPVRLESYPVPGFWSPLLVLTHSPQPGAHWSLGRWASWYLVTSQCVSSSVERLCTLFSVYVFSSVCRNSLT